MGSRYRPWLLSAGWVFCAGSSPVPAQSVPASLRACAMEADDARRLACYDREMARLLAAMSSPATPESQFGMQAELRRKKEKEEELKPPKLQKLVAGVTKVSELPLGVLLIELDNGQLWQQTERTIGFYVDSGEQVTITPGALGSFWIAADSRPPARVRRVR